MPKEPDLFEIYDTMKVPVSDIVGIGKKDEVSTYIYAKMGKKVKRVVKPSPYETVFKNLSDRMVGGERLNFERNIAQLAKQQQTFVG